MPKEIRIEFSSLPYKELAPNYHKTTHWATRSKVSHVARMQAFALGTDYVNSTKGFKTLSRCVVDEIFTVPDKKRRDIEGFLTAAKPWIDGLVGAGIVIDDDWEHVTRISGSIRHEKGIQKTEIIFREV